MFGFVVANGSGTRWRCWRDGLPAWTDDRRRATIYARREDAEAASQEDEEAWLIQPYQFGEPQGCREALACAVQHIEHMAAWIAKQHSGYSFEGLGEDMRAIRDILEASPEDPSKSHVEPNGLPGEAQDLEQRK